MHKFPMIFLVVIVKIRNRYVMLLSGKKFFSKFKPEYVILWILSRRKNEGGRGNVEIFNSPISLHDIPTTNTITTNQLSATYCISGERERERSC